MNPAGTVAKQTSSVPPRWAPYVSNSQPPALSEHMPPKVPMALVPAPAPAAVMSDWDLTNLLLAQMNYMQANSAYPYQQQLDAGYQAPEPISAQRGYPEDMSGASNNVSGLPAAPQPQAVDDPFAIWWDIPTSFTKCVSRLPCDFEWSINFMNFSLSQ